MSYLKKPLRRSALIGPWGVGAIVPFPNDESLMIAGLDMWQYSDAKPFLIKDERLQKRLGVQELRWPPDFRDRDSDPENCNLTIPAVRFPRWQYCPFCGSMRKVGLYSGPATCDAYQFKHGRKCNPDNKRQHRLIPERFVVVCPEGHIDDFPVAEWIHHDSGFEYNPETCKIRRSTGGTSAALTGVRYECTCGANRSIASAIRKGALARIGYTCKGGMPWLGILENNDKPCDVDPKELKVLQRGATNVWFADTISSIYIPTLEDDTTRVITALVEKTFNYVNSSRLDGEIPRDIVNVIACTNGVDPDELYKAFVDKANNVDGLPEVTETMTEDEFRLAEYKMLIKNSGGDAQDFHAENHPIGEYHSRIQPYFKSVTLVKKLRETRAFVGFTRLEPSSSKNLKKEKEMLRTGNGNWLPAIEVFGEGIFIEFDSDRLSEWAAKEKVKSRISTMNNAYQNSFLMKKNPGDLRPEFVLLHTFAHLLINQLSYECGYGSSSIRERIYCERTGDKGKMCGILLYTASGDSEGSLGGLVRQGEKGRLEDTILAALKNAEWCSADPICIESNGQGPESCNLAACHNCTLLPETCCEVGNRLLDRGVVIGTIENHNMGYFSDIGE